MTNNAMKNVLTANGFDRWQSIAAGILLALAGYTVMVSVPVLSTVAVEMLGFPRSKSVESGEQTWNCIFCRNYR